MLIRRLAAIFAADVAGYSRLIAADEEGTLSRLKALRIEIIDPKIADHGGRIVKTPGDGMLAEVREPALQAAEFRWGRAKTAPRDAGGSNPSESMPPATPI
jgi:adenylate cyclase